jgi:hypothetical protein
VDPVSAVMTVTCFLCGAELPVEAMTIELIEGGMAWVCGGIIPISGEDAISACEERRGL